MHVQVDDHSLIAASAVTISMGTLHPLDSIGFGVPSAIYLAGLDENGEGHLTDVIMQFMPVLRLTNAPETEAFLQMAMAVDPSKLTNISNSEGACEQGWGKVESILSSLAL